MEYYQNPVIVEQPERQPASTGLQVAAMVLGLIGAVMGFVCYMIMIMNQVRNGISAGLSDSDFHAISMAGNTGVIVTVVITAVLCAAAIILGAIGIARSIRRPRTVKGIVFSAVGLSAGIVGVSFALISLYVNGIFSAVMDAASKM